MKIKLNFALLLTVIINFTCNGYRNNLTNLKANGIVKESLVSEENNNINEIIESDDTSNEDNSRAIDITDYLIMVDSVGKSINLAKHEYINHNDVKMDNPIFDTTWYNNLGLVRTNINQVATTVVNANSFEGIVDELEDKANLLSSYSGGHSLFTATADAKFYDADMNYPNYTYQYYSSFSRKMKLFSYELPNYKTNLIDYRRHISDDFYDDAEMFLEGDLDRNTFFDRYGTHVIAKGIFGGTFDINYSLASNFYDVWSEYYSAISSYLNASLYSKVGAGDTSNFDVLSNFSFNSGLANQQINYVIRGGSNIEIGVTHTQIQAAHTQWLNTISTSPKIVEVTSDGLIPLWELIPIAYTDQSYKDYFIEQYQLYVASYESTVIDKYTPSIFDITTGVETGFEMFRVGEAVITDSGIYNQYYDVAELDKDFDLKYSYMLAHGYTKVDVYLQLEMREINKGYQIIAFYSRETASDAYLIDTFEFEYEGTSLGDEYGSTIGFARRNIPITVFDPNDPKVVFRYSARGTGNDDWENRLVYANVVYFK